MSKKTRKKSPKTLPGKSKRAVSANPTRKPAAKTRKATTGRSAKKTASKTPKKPASKSKQQTVKTSAKAAAKVPNRPTRAKSETRMDLTEGARAPAFRLPRDGGNIVSLADFAGKKLVLFFYPRADTPGCTREAIDFSRLADSFAQSQTTVLGVSADPPKAQESFRDKHELSVPLVSDETHGMLEAYGVWGEKSMYGKVFQGIIRTTVLIGTDGRVAQIWRHVKVDGHADAVLEAARAL